MMQNLAEILDLGSAHELIQNLGHKGSGSIPDGSNLPSDGDYDVDE